MDNGMFDLSATRAVVTGAGRGIGRAIAVAFGRHGATVALAARTTSELEAVAAEVEAVGGRCVWHGLDVCSPESVAEYADWATDALDGTVDVLVNNAGIYLPNRFLDYSADDWQRSWDVNVMGAVRMCQAFLPAMVEQGRGRVINIASTAGKYGSMNQSAYNASKHALVGLTRCLALETATAGVRVNAICPGFVDTDFLIGSDLQQLMSTDENGIRAMIAQRTPIGRPITPDEVAALAVYLASPLGDGMTGIPLTLAGGLVLV